MSSLVVTNAKVVLDDAIIEGTVAAEGGIITAVDAGGTALPSAIDAEGDYILPGLVDVHTDHLEKHVFPRAHVRWDMTRAVLAHDTQVAGGGVTTVFDALCVGNTENNPTRREIFQPMVDALEAAPQAAILRAEHLIHLRCEVTDNDAPAQLSANIARPMVRLVSVMEHVPGKRQSRDMGNYIRRRMAASGKDETTVREEITELLERLEAEAVDVRADIVSLARQHRLPLLSHDDATVEHVQMAHEEGVRIAEFPVSLEAAQEARRLSMHAVAGAPNYLRGGSQSGNIAVFGLLAEGLVDILASDYVPRSMLDAAFAIAADERLPFDVPQAIRLVTSGPARAAGLDDRGEILPGLKADLVRVKMVDDTPVVRAVWRSGKLVN